MKIAIAFLLACAFSLDAQITATLDGGQCATPTIQPGKSDGLVFTTAGTYKFHCAIHPTQMTGTITVS